MQNFDGDLNFPLSQDCHDMFWVTFFQDFRGYVSPEDVSSFQIRPLQSAGMLPFYRWGYWASTKEGEVLESTPTATRGWSTTLWILASLLFPSQLQLWGRRMIINWPCGLRWRPPGSHEEFSLFRKNKWINIGHFVFKLDWSGAV